MKFFPKKVGLLHGALMSMVLLFGVNVGYGQISDPSPYCNPQADCRFDAIQQFSFANVTNNRGCVFNNNVTYFDNTTINVTKGQSYTVSAQLPGGFFGPENFIAVWIDYNKNFSFEPNELVTKSTSAVENFSANVSIPTDIPCGLTRLRVMTAVNNEIDANSACTNPGQFGDGEVQDFNIFIDNAGNAPAKDVAVNFINAEPDTAKPAFGDLTVGISNQGSQALSAGDTIPLSLSTSLEPNTIIQYELPQKLGVCKSIQFTLDKIISNACPGNNNIQLVNLWAPDSKATNDTARTQIFSFVKKQNLLTEGFESGPIGQLPSGWTGNASGNANGISSCGSNSGSNSFILEGDDGEFVETRQIDVSGKGPIQVKFKYVQGEGTAVPTCGENPDGGEDVLVQYWDGSQYVTQTTLVADGTGEENWASVSFTLPQPLPSDFRVRLQLIPGGGFITNGDSWVFDDFKINEGQRFKNATPPQATIVPQKAFVNAPEVFTFSGNTDKLAWSLNGNKLGNSGKQLVRAFSDTGKNTVTVKRAGCFLDTVTSVIDVVEPTQKPKANFFTNKNVLCAEEVIKVRNESVKGATDFKWRISPQNVNGLQAYTYLNSDSAFQPRIQFLQPGNYNVTLIASNAFGSDTFTQSRYLKVTECYESCKDMMTSDAEGLLFDSSGREAFVDAEGASSCAFTINPSCADEVVANLRKMMIAAPEVSGAAPGDNLKVYDGTSTSAPPIHTRLGYPQGFYKGNAPAGSQSIVAKSGAMTVVLNTDGEDDMEDFVLEWETNQSAGQALRQDIDMVGLNAPDTAFTLGNTTFRVNNPVPGAEYQIVIPGFNRSVSQDTIIPVTVSGLDPGSYKVRLIAQKCGYSDTSQEMVFFKDVNGRPIADFTASATTVFKGDTIQLFDLSKPGAVNHEWSFNPAAPISFVNGTDSATVNPQIVIDQTGKYRVDLIASNRFGRSVEAKIDYITVENRPTVQSCTPAVGQQVNDLSINEFNIYRKNGELIYTNTSGYSSNGYGQFDASSDVALKAGREYIFEMERNTAFNDFAFGVWLDFNGDGDLTAKEALFKKMNETGFSTRDTVMIRNAPADDKILRIATNRAGASLRGCGPHQVGEFEDYTIKFPGDTDAPTITLKGGDTVTVDICNRSAADTGATAFDVVEGNLSGQVELRNQSLLSVPGTYNLPYVVFDSSGNKASKTQTIIVTPDTVDPNVALQGSANITINLNESFNDPGATASDACGEVDTILRKGMVNPGIIGSKTLRYIAVDGGGNRDTVSRVVNVRDPVAPTGQLIGKDTVVIPVFGSYQDPGIVANDNYLDSTFVTVKGSVNRDSVGVYELTYEIRDLDTNLTTLKRIVIVEDNKAPMFSDIPDNAVVLPVNNPLDVPFKVNDNFYGESSLQVEKMGGFFETFPNGFADSIGTYTARFKVIDGSGNANSFSIAVDVVDRIAPTITLDRPVVNINRFGQFRDSLGGTFQVKDNYYDLADIRINRFGSYFKEYIDGGQRPGVYEIRYQAFDGSGNASETIIRTVNVRERTTGVNGNPESMAVEVYPNPTDGLVNLELGNLPENQIAVSVINAKGQTVRSLDRPIGGQNRNYQLDLSNEAKGLYKVKVRAGDEVVTESVVVQ